MKQREETIEGSAGKKGRWQGFWAVLLGGAIGTAIVVLGLHAVFARLHANGVPNNNLLMTEALGGLVGGGFFAGVFMIVLPIVLFQTAGMMIARAVRKKVLRKEGEGEEE